MTVKFTVLGEPKGKGRPMFIPKTGRAITPKDTVNYETLVRLEYGVQCSGVRFPDNAQLDMRILAFYGIPKSMTKKNRELVDKRVLRPTKKPDMDNVVKIIADSLNGLAYRDDTQIVDCQVRKFYSERPRVEVTIRQISNEESEDN